MCDVVTVLNETCLETPLACGACYEDRNDSSNDSIKRQIDNYLREETPTSSQGCLNNYDSYIIQYYRDIHRSKKKKRKKKKVRFSDDDDDDGNCNNVLAEWICYSDNFATDEGDEKKPLDKDGSKWYKYSLNDSLLATGHLVSEGNYQGDDDIKHCIRGLEFKLVRTKSLEMKRNRRIMSLNAVFEEQERQQKKQQQQEIQRQQINGFILALNHKKISSKIQQAAVVDTEKIASMYAKACLPSRKLAMLFGIYDAKEAIRIYNGQNESLSVLICRRLLELDAINDRRLLGTLPYLEPDTINSKYSRTKELTPFEREVEERLRGKQQQRRRRTRRQRETICVNMTKKPKCLYLENIEEILLSVLEDDSTSFHNNNNDYNGNSSNKRQ